MRQKIRNSMARLHLVIIFFALGLVGVLGFQNCSEVNFAPVDQKQPVAAQGATNPPVSIAPVPTATPPVVVPTPVPTATPPVVVPTPVPTATPPVVVPTPVPTATPNPPTPTPVPPSPTPVVVCPTGQAVVDGKCMETIYKDCMRFVDLGTLTQIPSLAATGVCYYKKLLSATENHPSGQNGEKRTTDVLSRDHQDYNSKVPVNPFVIGDTKLNLTFLANRKVSLASSKVANAAEIQSKQLKIDNYILVEVTDATRPKIMQARGTRDALPFVRGQSGQYTNGPILVNNQPVNDFISYAELGTATVPVLDISSDFAVNVPTELRVRMLDCGGSAEATDMYLIIH